jgi:hypothetical protein
MPRLRALVAASILLSCATTPRDPEAPTTAEVPVVEAAHAWCEQQGQPAGPPSRSFATDGCTGWPDGDLVQCCVEHDIAYWCGGTADQRRTADELFRDCAREQSPAQSGLVYYTVRVWGVPWLPTSWRWGYGHAFGGGYASSAEQAR